MIKGYLYFLFYAFVFFIFFFGIVQFFPKSTKSQVCTYNIRPFLQNHIVRINYPVWPRSCR